MFKNINGLLPDHFVFNYPKGNEDKLMAMLCAGGFAVVRFEEQSQKEEAVEFFSSFHKEAADFLSARAIGEPFVGATKEVIDLLSPDHVAAILLHEKGHLVADHAATREFGDCEPRLEQELEADAYAASIVGKEVLAGALRATIQVVCMLVSGIKGFSEEKCSEMVAKGLAHPMMVARLEALEN